MALWISLLLGIIQGAAEFLPISSSGHLAIIQYLYSHFSDTPLPNPHLFDVMLHVATLCAVFIAFRRDIAELFHAFLSFFSSSGRQSEKERPARRFLILIVIATLPLIVGVFLENQVEALTENLTFVGCALLLTGVLLFVSDRLKPGKKNEKTSLISDAVAVGIMQAIAVIPGLSRSGATITAGLMRGFDRQFAVKFSFIMSIPAVLGAALLKAFSLIGEEGAGADFLSYIPGMLAAGVVGYFSIQLLRKIVARNKFGGFAYYCAAVGVVALILPLILPNIHS